MMEKVSRFKLGSLGPGQRGSVQLRRRYFRGSPAGLSLRPVSSLITRDSKENIDELVMFRDKSMLMYSSGSNSLIPTTSTEEYT